jgi:hypothetical protein
MKCEHAVSRICNPYLYAAEAVSEYQHQWSELS